MFDVSYDTGISFDQYMNNENELSDFILNDILESFNLDIFNIESAMLEDASNNSLIIESVTNGLLASIRKLYMNLISEIRRFITDIKIGTERASREMSYISKLDNMEKLVKDAKNMGKKYVYMANIQGMLDIYKKYYNELSSQCKKIAKMRYKDTLTLDKDLEVYRNIVKKYEREFEKVSNEEVRISIDDAIRFVEHEKTGNSKVLDTLNDLITDVKLMQKDVEDIMKKEEDFGSDVLPKHVSVLGRITTDMFKSIRKMCGKIIGKLVFRFA